MEKFSNGLKSIFTFDFRYTLLLLYFLLLFSFLIYYDVPVLVLLFFVVGLILIPISFQKKNKEIAELKMKVLYVKTKLSDRITEFENILKASDKTIGREAIERALDKIKLDSETN